MSGSSPGGESEGASEEAAPRGAVGGSSNEGGGEYRRAVAAYFAAHGLNGDSVVGIGVASPEAVVRGVALEQDHAVDDVAVELRSGYLLMVQAKRSVTDARAFKKTARQWVVAVRAPDFDVDRHRLVLCTAHVPRWVEALGRVLTRERAEYPGKRTREEQRAVNLLDRYVADADANERAAIRASVVIRPLFVEEEHLTDAEVGRRLLDGFVVQKGEGLEAWHSLIRIAGKMARERTGGDMRRWRNDLRHAGHHVLPPKDAAAARDIPRMLPRAPSRFVNRDEELGRLTRISQTAARSAPIVALLRGQRGVGKTVIGRHWAARNRNLFHDGDLFVDYSKRREHGAVEVNQILAELLRKVAGSEVSLPDTFSERVELFQRCTESKKLLVLLDDAGHPSEVGPLIPGGAGSMVIVTSNYRLEELVRHEAQAVSVTSLDAKAARRLLVEVVGDAARFDDDPEATDELIEDVCRGLPIALCVCGAYLGSRRRMPVANFVAELKRQPERLFTLVPPEERSSMGVFEFSYQELPPSAARLYRALGIHPGPDFTSAVPAVLAGVPLADARSALRILHDAYLVEEIDSDRFEMHGLILDHARMRASTDEPDPQNEQALRRLVEWYRDAAALADHALVEDRTRVADKWAPPEIEGLSFGTRAEVFAWFDAERPNILAILQAADDREWGAPLWQMVEALWNLYSNRRPYTEWKESHKIGLRAALRCSNDAAEAQMRKQISRAYVETNELEEAKSQLGAARAAAKRSGNPRMIATVMEFTGTYLRDIDELDRAMQQFRRARALYKALGVRRGMAMQDLLIGNIYVLRGEHDKAIAPLRRSLRVLGEMDDEFSVGRILLWLGMALKGAGHIAEAEPALTEAIGILARYGLRLEEAQAHEMLAEVADLNGRPKEAYAHRYDAYEICLDLGDPRAPMLADVLRRFDKASPAAG